MNASVMDLAALLDDEIARAEFVAALATDLDDGKRLDNARIQVRYLQAGGEPNPWAAEDYDEEL